MIHFPDNEPLMMPWCSSFSPMQARIEMIMHKGLGIIVPDRIMPIFNPEPFTLDELKEIFGTIKPTPNISKLRSIIRNKKMKHEH